ncbi:protein adenylyltransferase SelO [Pseudonocardia sp. H11422]|uniref:protein adenylyltransferase SelO n=1 Tax=Pseudonocardia sp. H11422 TaxID=2835866 RepID=UPI001BDD63D5|nr:YdiU family protein [Pseudonocardia sp. H11422]
MTVAARVLFEFDDSFARELPGLCVPWTAAPVPAPELLVLNEELATELGSDPDALRAPAGVALLVGSGVPDGVSPVAQAYAGHQFGGYVPRLGDGRALLIGELVDSRGQRRDLHLKGSGRTPFARGGDGKAAVGPMLREYLMGEAMHALGIPTTRGLAVVATGETVVRERRLPGAVLARVAASHLRVGTFQYAAASGDPALVQKLADYAIARHHPEAAGAQNPYLELYRRVVDVQAALVARWMLVGFVHGVMNTDNMTISGETIDYGPCAFMDAFSPATVFSSIDHSGRYAYGNQPRIAQWNLARLGETLLPLIDESTDAAVEAATDAVNSFAECYHRYAADGMAAKLGLQAADGQLTQDLLDLLNAQQVDFTRFFRALSSHLRGRPEPVRALFAEPEAFDAWAGRWQALLPPDRAAAAASMDRVNPAYIPRNHRVEEALAAATDGDMGPFVRLVEVLARPFVERPGLESYREPAPMGSAPHVTYCGT